MSNDPKACDSTETIPSTAGALSGVASANAPFIYWDLVGAFGIFQGVGHLTLEVARHTPGDTFPLIDRVTAAHLRMSLASVRDLRDALDKILLMAAVPPTKSPPS